MEISPDAIILFKWNGIHLNATILFTWVVMLILIIISWLVSDGTNRDWHCGGYLG